MVSTDPDKGEPDEDAAAAAALGLRPLSPAEHRARRRAAEAMAGALTLVMVDENNAYEHRPDTWFR
ncbi:hypothetical protein ACFHW2_09535 [Actinomadura sp. LOL_016]|uniref:hypothetical protein n=1 Tax=unclassified Actinomadura TaxID=2626254 RepID=UPI003A7F778C